MEKICWGNPGLNWMILIWIYRIDLAQDEDSWQAVLTAVMKLASFIICGESLK
jgi:hypothetical protein